MDSDRPGKDRRGGGLRWLTFGCGGLIVALLAAGFGYLAWANSPLPPIDPEPAPPNPNGYDVCLPALANRPLLSANSAFSRADTAPLAELQSLLAVQDAGGEKVRAALTLEYRNPPFRNLQASYPEVRQYQQLAQRWTAEARVQRTEGKPEIAIDRCLDAMELGSRVAGGGGILHHATGIACQLVTLHQAELAVPQLSAPQARAARRRLARILRQTPTAVDLAEVERRANLYAVRQMFGGRTGTLKAMNMDGSTLIEPLLMALYPKPRSYREMDGYYQASLEELKKPYPARRQPEIPRDVFCSLLLPAMVSVSTRLTQRDACLQLFRLELALQEYRLAHGRYPSRLEQLVPSVLDRVPRDPFTAQPFPYRLTKTGYLLYSLSSDGKDDGGRVLPRSQRNSGSTGDLVAGKLKEKK